MHRYRTLFAAIALGTAECASAPEPRELPRYQWAQVGKVQVAFERRVDGIVTYYDRNNDGEPDDAVFQPEMGPRHAIPVRE